MAYQKIIIDLPELEEELLRQTLEQARFDKLLQAPRQLLIVSKTEQAETIEKFFLIKKPN